MYPRRVSETIAKVLQQIDRVHDEDPVRTGDGRARERVYAERMSAWLARLVEAPSDALRIAVRAQHLARWRSPRDAYPEGRVGYLKWRKEAGERHAADVAAIVRDETRDEALAARVASLVTKKDRLRDPESQALEDCACLVFLELDYAPFVAKHDDDAKVIDIVRKTWAKMSARGREEALRLPLEGRGLRLVQAALA